MAKKKRTTHACKVDGDVAFTARNKKVICSRSAFHGEGALVWRKKGKKVGNKLAPLVKYRSVKKPKKPIGPRMK